MRACSALWVVWLAIFVSSSSLAQTGTSSVGGIVLDKSGAAVAAAKVSISNNGQALQRETQTDDSGGYRFLACPRDPIL